MNKPLNIAILGYGRMGHTIESILLERTKTGETRYAIPLKIRAENRSELTVEALGKCDVAIEFSQPEAAVDNLYLCLKAGIPVVTGTTGWLDDFEAVKNAFEKEGGTLLYASNFSVGMNIFFAVNERLAQLMNGQTAYKVNLEELHHIHKKDAPSGTAISLAAKLIHHLDYLKEWKLGEITGDSQLPIRAIREDEVPGTHLVRYSSRVDTIEIKHTAHNREGFALGAILAAEWVIGKKGVFGMKDVLGIA